MALPMKAKNARLAPPFIVKNALRADCPLLTTVLYFILGLMSDCGCGILFMACSSSPQPLKPPHASPKKSI